jgi:two-component system LytT family response regulator
MGSALPSSTLQRMRPTRDSELEPPSIASAGTGTGASDVILVKTGFRQVAVRVGEILYVEAARNYVRIHLDNGAVLKTRVPIDRLGRHLGSQRFLRIHRGRLVNMERIRSVRSLAGGRLQLTLSQGAMIIVARDRRRAVLAEIGAAGERRA